MKKISKTVMSGMAKVCDGLVNAYTNVGTKQDSRIHAKVYHTRMTEQDADSLYAGDAMARKLVDRIPYEGTRRWIELLDMEASVSNAFSDEFRRLDVISQFRRAWVLARLYGGAVILVNLDDGMTLDMPVNLDAIDRIDSLVVFQMHEIVPNIDIDADVASSNFGLPASYRLSARETNMIEDIHHSRLIRFDGSFLPPRLFVENNYWHDSVLNALKTPIVNYSQAHDQLASMMQSFRQQILKVEDFTSILSMEDGLKIMSDRIALQDLMQSSLKTNVVDSRDDFSIVSTPLTGISDAFEIINHRLVASTNMPHTIVLGDSPVGGLGNLGETENRSWYDHVSDQQEDVLRQPITKFLTLLGSSKEGPMSGNYTDIEFEFRPLWQLKDLDRSKMELDVAKKDEIYLNNNVLAPNEVRQNRFGKLHFSQETYIEGEMPESEQEEVNVEEPESDDNV
jgi:phage-related protein (TIGR01555 family)